MAGDETYPPIEMHDRCKKGDKVELFFKGGGTYAAYYVGVSTEAVPYALISPVLGWEENRALVGIVSISHLALHHPESFFTGSPKPRVTGFRIVEKSQLEQAASEQEPSSGREERMIHVLNGTDVQLRKVPLDEIDTTYRLVKGKSDLYEQRQPSCTEPLRSDELADSALDCLAEMRGKDEIQ